MTPGRTFEGEKVRKESKDWKPDPKASALTSTSVAHSEKDALDSENLAKSNQTDQQLDEELRSLDPPGLVFATEPE